MIPEKVIFEDGTKLFTKLEIEDGQNVRQLIGGLVVGAIFTIGALAPDWFVIGLKTGWSVNKEKVN